MSEWKADNYIFCCSLKGQTHIAVIGIFTRQPPRYNADRRKEREGRRSAGQDRCYIRKEIERKNRGSEGDPLPFHRQMQWLFIELIFRGSEAFTERYIALNGEQARMRRQGANGKTK